MSKDKTMDHAKVASAFNCWMDDYTKNPDAFATQHKSAIEFLRAKADGNEPTYGDACAALLQEYLKDA